MPHWHQRISLDENSPIVCKAKRKELSSLIVGILIWKMFHQKRWQQKVKRRYSEHTMRCSGKKYVRSYILKRSRSLDEDTTNHLRKSMIARKNTIKSRLAEESRRQYFHRQSCRDSCRKKITTEKTTFILIAIVALFLLTHSYRLSIKFYEALMPKSNTVDSFDFCFSLGRWAQ